MKLDGSQCLSGNESKLFDKSLHWEMGKKFCIHIINKHKYSIKILNYKSNYLICNYIQKIERKGLGNMLGIDVIKTTEELIIKWQLAKVSIPLNEIIKVTEDDTYAGVEKLDAIRIGTAYNTTDRIVIKTKKQDYVLFTTNKVSILNKINA